MADHMTGLDEIPNWELAAAACFLEGGARKLVHTEDLAVRAFQLAPQRFCWKKYPERIDLDIARVSLTDAAKVKNGALVQGSKDSGWSLTQAGIKWVDQARKRLPKLFQGEAILDPDRRSTQAVAADREAERLRQSDAYQKWQSGRPGDLTVYDFFKATRTSEYLPTAQMNLRRTQLVQLVAGEAELVRFVDDLFNRFAGSYRDGME